MGGSPKQCTICIVWLGRAGAGEATLHLTRLEREDLLKDGLIGNSSPGQALHEGREA